MIIKVELEVDTESQHDSEILEQLLLLAEQLKSKIKDD